MSVFRSAQPESPASEPSKAADKPIESGGTPVETHIDTLLATYQDDQGKPYVAKYLELDNVWDQDETLKRDVQEIESYMQDQVKKGKVDNSTRAGKEFLKEMERKAGLNRYESGTQRITKLLAYIDFRRTVDG